MDIAQAKQELRRTIRAYTAKTEDGVYRMPRRMQRPVLLMGPPGIGKTAILSQLAQEEHIGLAAYTMTHHTRQSALGLPVIVGRTAAGKTFRATEYTMSEIIASVYEQMEKTGLHEGILFLDEINCVSETLMPAILQMLQNKTFGVHSLPEGWLIVAAGNPPRYNQSARSFDMATLDRVRCIELEPSLAAWQPYAAASGVHPAVLSYLRLHPEHFFLCSASAEAGEFATARGWEELSALLLAYEALGYPCTLAQMQQYLHAQEAAAGFTAFYELFRRYAAQLPLEEILTGGASPEAGALRELPFDGRLSVVEFLLHSLQTKSAAMQQDADLAFSASSFAGSIPPGADALARAQELLRKRRAALAVRKDCDVLPPEEERVIAAFTAAEKPILGICRGLQALNVFFGGTLYAYIPDHQSPEGDIVHATRAVGELAGLVGTEPLVNSNHHQAVHRLGAGLSVRQWAGDGVIEGICHTALPILAVQWHPERLRTGADGAAVFRWLRRCVEKGCGG